LSALAEVAAAVDPSLRAYLAEPVPAARFSGDRAFALEAVYEGFLLHYREPRAFAGMDADLRLLAGDTLYALGLDRLAREGDLDAVAELGDLISLCAQAEAEGRSDLIEPLWEASVRRLAGDGPGARADVARTHGFSA
jgi:hypothetical protein